MRLYYYTLKLFFAYKFFNNKNIEPWVRSSYFLLFTVIRKLKIKNKYNKYL